MVHRAAMGRVMQLPCPSSHQEEEALRASAGQLEYLGDDTIYDHDAGERAALPLGAFVGAQAAEAAPSRGVAELCAMGFEAARAAEMLELSGGDVDGAVALLCS